MFESNGTCSNIHVGRVPPAMCTVDGSSRRVGPALRGRIVAIVLAVMVMSGAAPAAPLNDPTRPPSAKAVKPTKAVRKQTRWILSSTLVSAQRRSAVINDRVVSVGEKINGARVVAIQPASVHLRRHGSDITLVLLKKNVKRPSRRGSGKP